MYVYVLVCRVNHNRRRIWRQWSKVVVVDRIRLMVLETGNERSYEEITDLINHDQRQLSGEAAAIVVSMKRPQYCREQPEQR